MTVLELQELGLDNAVAQRLLANQILERGLTGDASVFEQRLMDVAAGVGYCQDSGGAEGCFLKGQALKYTSDSVNAAVFALVGAYQGGLKPGGGKGGTSTGETTNPATGNVGSKAAEKITWVDEGASMSPRARLYDDGAIGSRSNAETQKGQAPTLTRTTADGQKTNVRFDGVDGDVLIDRKISVVMTQKARDQVLRQSEALQQNSLSGRWEVPNQSQADRATRMFNELGVKNITVKVVPE